MNSKFKKITAAGLAGVVGAATTTYFLLRNNERPNWPVSVKAQNPPVNLKKELPSRSEQIKSLKSDQFDIIVIGGGATGAGCALDAATRGLKTALIEANDFSSGTSSRSTKLIHGGLFYLKAAVQGLDRECFEMLQISLNERTVMLNQAPYLAGPLAVMLPLYRWWQVFYYWFGMKMFDIMSGKHSIESSYYVSKSNALKLFPMLKSDNLVGGIVYYDGQHDDSRMNLAIVMTATLSGATIANHITMTGLVKSNDAVSGVSVRDELTGETWDIRGKCVVNATGAFIDTIRKMDDPKAKDLGVVNCGVHLTLPGYYGSEQMGLLDPNITAGIAILVPWQGHTIVGSADSPCDVSYSPMPTDNDIDVLLKYVNHYFSSSIKVRKADVLSAWNGVRGLVWNPKKPGNIAWKHVIEISKSGLLTIGGGSWTTYRVSACDTIDTAIKCMHLKPSCNQCITDKLKLVGSEKWEPTTYLRLVQEFGMEVDVAKHLSNTYGDKAFVIANMASPTGKRWPVVGRRIHPEYPYIEAEVKYGIKEYAVTAVDMIARRTRLAFLNAHAAQEALSLIVDIMGQELSWSNAEKEKQCNIAAEFLQTEMGKKLNDTTKT
ncbi:unnamed protein product [Phyllotreta striolata]|uniref:Glycerol-3-phosphate dehydrogenase n=1 Tax=Phyllotreta striolata TaxID=444603 RepID=A0A9N9XJG5_PHYSR|nr:unnamed protein product [Phyllotreta striolata]